MPKTVRLDGKFEPPAKAQSGKGKQQSAAFLAEHGLDRKPYVLFVSTIESRKNHLLAFNTWLKLIKKWGLAATPNLVCIGKYGWMFDAAVARLESSDLLKQKVLVLSDISDIELAALYQACLFTIYPSFYEGWGLPVTESLCYGKVPMTSSVSSLPEAGGDFAEYFDFESERDFLEKLERMIVDAKYRSKKEQKIKTSFRPREWAERLIPQRPVRSTSCM